MKKTFLCALLGALSVCAAAAPLKSTSDSVVLYKLGDFTFAALNNSEGEIKNELIGSNVIFAKYDGWNKNALNYFVLDTGKEKILFDTGLPAAYGGKLVERLKQTGLSPKNINIICITHMHGDHIGGLVDAKGKRVFTKARLYIPKEEADYWREKGDALALSVFKAYEGKITFFEQNAKVTDFITTVPLFGHTPGHSGFMLESAGQKLLVWGDILHADLQFRTPDFYLVYDVNPELAIKTRKAILERAAKEGFAIAGMHVVKPGVGTVLKEGEGYRLNSGI